MQPCEKNNKGLYHDSGWDPIFLNEKMYSSELDWSIHQQGGDSNWNLTFRASTALLTGTDMNYSKWQIVCIRPVPGPLIMFRGWNRHPWHFPERSGFVVPFHIQPAMEMRIIVIIWVCPNSWILPGLFWLLSISGHQGSSRHSNTRVCQEQDHSKVL